MNRLSLTYGKMLKFARQKRGLSQNQMANETGMTQSYISALEQGVGSIDKYMEVLEKIGYKPIKAVNIDLIYEGELPLKFLIVD